MGIQLHMKQQNPSSSQTVTPIQLVVHRSDGLPGARFGDARSPKSEMRRQTHNRPCPPVKGMLLPYPSPSSRQEPHHSGRRTQPPRPNRPCLIRSFPIRVCALQCPSRHPYRPSLALTLTPHPTPHTTQCYRLIRHGGYRMNLAPSQALILQCVGCQVLQAYLCRRLGTLCTTLCPCMIPRTTQLLHVAFQTKVTLWGVTKLL
jgi:hypothetical protein